MLRSDSRQRYVGELRRRVSANGRSAAAPVDSDQCLVCGSSRVRDKTISHQGKNKTFVVLVCQSCGHVANPTNINDYTQYTSLEKMPVAKRVGTEEKAGREFRIAEMGMSILGGKNREVMLYGPGRSKDYQRIGEMKRVDRVAVGDIMEFIDDAEFVDLGVAATSRTKFDLVIACEVVEHFTNPAEDFAKLFSYLKDDGLAICSTNIYDGGNLNKHSYIFVKGHTSYYTPRAIQSIAEQNDIHFDFRLPSIATTYGGPRKRYLLFTRSPKVLQNITVYFGGHPFAPSV